MTRGDQRERDREKNRKKLEKGTKGKNESGTAYLKKKEADAVIMRQKQQKAQEKKTEEAAGTKK